MLLKEYAEEALWRCHRSPGSAMKSTFARGCAGAEEVMGFCCCTSYHVSSAFLSRRGENEAVRAGIGKVRGAHYAFQVCQ